jgi:hypothetical protein
MPAGPRLAATEAMLRVCFFPLPQSGRRDEWAGADRTNDRHHRARAVDSMQVKTAGRVLRVHAIVTLRFYSISPTPIMARNLFKSGSCD